MGPRPPTIGLVYNCIDDKSDNRWDEPQHIPVPLTEVNIKTTVVNFIARVEVTQKYVNKEKNPIEAQYFFPVEEEAAVVEFIAKLDDRKVTTVVKKKEDAEEEYQEAISNKQTAFLLEETRPDIFQVKVGHLAPFASCEVTITYLTELLAEDGKTRLTIPTTITPKYIPFTDDSPAAKKIASIEYDFNTQASMTMQVDAMMKTKIKAISSPSHNIVNNIEKEDSLGYFRSQTNFKGSTADMDQDIVILIDTDQPNEARLDVEKSEDGSMVAMLSLVPYFELDDTKAEIIFLIDCSGSMRGESINLAKEALQLLLSSLNIDCYFNIFRFGSSYEALFPESRKYDDITLDEAKKHAINMQADLGGTEILSPLEVIFKQDTIKGHPKQVFVLTDGAVSNSEACISCVKKNSSTNRVFTMGIGSGADRNLVKGMARAGKGSAVFATYGEKLAPKVLRQLKHSLTPCISNVKVDWGDETSQHVQDKPEKETKKSLIGFGKPKKQDDVRLSKETQAPIIVPPIYDGSRLLLYKMYKTGEKPKDVKITAETPVGPLDVDIPYEDNYFEDEFIHQMFARKLIQDLEEGNYDTADGDEAKGLIVDLGVKYRLASKHTSFIGVDDRKGKDVGLMKLRQVKNQVTKGYGMLGQQERSAAQYATRSNGNDRSRGYGNEKCMGGMDSLESMTLGCSAKKSRRSKLSSMKSSIKSRFHMPKMRKSRSSPDRNEKCMGGGSSDDSGDDNKERCMGSAPAPTIQPHSVSTGEPTDTQKLLKITSLQVANGSFKREEVIVEISGKSMIEIDDEAIKENVDKDVWFAALIVALIESMFADDKDSWEMIVEKARKWIKKCGADNEDLINKAKIFLQ